MSLDNIDHVDNDLFTRVRNQSNQKQQYNKKISSIITTQNVAAPRQLKNKRTVTPNIDEVAEEDDDMKSIMSSASAYKGYGGGGGSTPFYQQPSSYHHKGGGGKKRTGKSVEWHMDQPIPWPSLPEQEREKRELKWLETRHRGKKLDNIEKDKIAVHADRMQALSMIMDHLAVSANVMKINTSPFIPLNAHRTSYGRFYGSVIMDHNHRPCPMQVYAPQNINECFGSKTDYAQGPNLHLKNERGGNLKNGFMISMKFDYVNNPSGQAYAMVLVSEDEIKRLDGNTETQYKIFGGATEYIDGGDKFLPGKSNHAHFVLPPYYTGKDVVFYHSSPSIDNAYATENTWLTADPEVIEEALEPDGNTRQYVPYNHPIYEQIMTENQLPNEEYEKIIFDKKQFAASIPNEIVNDAMCHLHAQMEHFVPVCDLNKLRMLWCPILGDEASDVLYPQWLRKCEHEREEQQKKLNEDRSNKSAKANKVLEEHYLKHPITFKCEFHFMFRDPSEESLIPEEQVDESG